MWPRDNRICGFLPKHINERPVFSRVEWMESSVEGMTDVHGNFDMHTIMYLATLHSGRRCYEV